MGASASKDYIAATDGSSTVLVRRYEVGYYSNLLSVLHKHFPDIAKELMIIQTKELDICDGRYINIPEELWVEVSPRIRNIKVASRPAQISAKQPELGRGLPPYEVGHAAQDGQPK